MRRYTLLLLLLCMHCIAGGQTGFDYRYWFDNDYSTIHQGHSATGKWQIDAEMDGLSESLHAIHLQVIDSKGIESAPVTRFFLKTRDTSVKQGYYWFDGDRSAQQLSGQVQGVFTIDVAKLTEGFHTFYYQVVGKDGSLSAIVSRSFYKVVVPEAARYRCWVDDDPTTMTTGKYTGAPVLVDISQISEGYHIMRVQIEDVTPSAVVSRPFVKIPQTEGVEYLKCLCVVDDKLYKEENVSSAGGVINWNFDVSSLPQGFHRMQVQVITPSGAATSTYDSYFLRTTTTDEMSQMKCVYAIDGAEYNTEAGHMTNGAFHCELDVAHLEDGLHRIAYKLTNGKGVETKTQTQFFIKTPLGGNGITEYRYWLNDSTEQVSKVKLAERTNPYRLISLLPVPKHPVSSKLFQFELTDGQPMIYAKNNIHIRFYDAAGRFTDETAQFVDYQTKQEVTDITPIYNGERKTMAVPEKDVTHWFKFYAEEGDTVTFKTDQAASIQVFSPEGKEIYSASGSTSVRYGGCHTWIDGTYYVALHDVTGSRPNISLDFTHLAKYDVVSYDVAAVGNGGCSTITFKGNGFKDLYAVDFVNAANDSIHAFSIGHESDGTTSVTADFTSVAIGKYTALFHFTEGKKYVYDAITVEEAMPIELATEVTFPRSFGHVVTYTCKITNNGNMTAYAVPIYTWLKSKRLDGISHIEYDGLDLRGFYDEIETDTLSTEEIRTLKSESAKLGHDHYFFKLWTEDEDNPGDSVFIRANYFFTNIAPYETKTLHLTLTMREVDAFAYFTVPEEWPSYGNYEQSSAGSRIKMRHASESSNSWYCCYRERIECAANITMLVLDAATLVNPELGVADCALGWANQRLTAAGDTYCGKNDVEGDFAKRVNALTKTASAASVLAGCAGHAIGSNVINAFLHPSVAINCITAFFQKIPGCPPDPPGGGGAQGGKSHDPNEIYGYLAESGSKFMTDEVEKVNYRIEFENDPAFATRSAMTVVIRDTLDSKLFDLATYAPTGIKIGEKVEYLDGEPNFVKTIDMRPEINGLVEVEGKYNATKGILTWTFTSIDPMTMEPTNDPMDGFLPVNVDGNGIGEVTFDIALRQKLAEGTEIPNRAGIVFDINDVILTPTWKNIVDASAPESHVTDVQMATDSTAVVRIAATDELSGPWRYNVYVQYGSGAWFLGAENVPIDSVACVKIYEGIDHGFYTLVTDSAGNVEQKEAAREFSFEVFAPQVDTNTKIELAQGWNWISHNQQEVLAAEALKPKAQRIVSQTDELFKDSRFGWTGDLEKLLPTELYKVQMAEADEVQLSGKLFNAAFRSIPLYEGWNWMGYPVANTMSPAEALQRMEAEEGDFIVGQDGLATFTEGQWTGTLMEMQPGLGYMYRSVSDKNLFYNATAQSSSRRANVQRSMVTVQCPDGWTVDKRKYPNVMGLVADLLQDGEIQDANEWLVAAFCGEECRGLSQVVNGHLMMNIYGQGGERITFMAQNRESGEVMGVEENETFRTDILGTMQHPYELHSGVLTGIAEIEDGRLKTNNSVYDLQGRHVEKSSVANGGVYIVTDGGKTKKHVNYKRNK